MVSRAAGWALLVVLAGLIIIVGLQGQLGVLLACIFVPDEVDVAPAGTGPFA